MAVNVIRKTGNERHGRISSIGEWEIPVKNVALDPRLEIII